MGDFNARCPSYQNVNVHDNVMVLDFSHDLDDCIVILQLASHSRTCFNNLEDSPW